MNPLYIIPGVFLTFLVCGAVIRLIERIHESAVRRAKMQHWGQRREKA